MLRLRNLRLPPDAGEKQLYSKCAQTLGVSADEILSLKILRRALDARRKSDIHYEYTLAVTLRGDESRALKFCKNCEKFELKEYQPPMSGETKNRPVVVGFGPAGMFAALLLSEAGLRPIVLERGADVESRREIIEKFWNGGKLDPECNVQFGEGGAGTFSDGKLNTGTRDERISWVLSRLHGFGAAESIMYDSRPHVGTDVLIRVVKNLRERVLEQGGEIFFRHRLDGFYIEDGKLVGAKVTSPDGEYRLDCRDLILAIGHSARDTFEIINKANIPMQPKSFSMGVRIEHPQSLIDLAQYGRDRNKKPKLPAAEYRLNCQFEDGESAYTFCMCPGGYVVAAASETGGVVTNGMSYSGRAGENANSALLVTLRPEDFPYPGALGGMYWQREIEQAAFKAANSTYRAPAQYAGDFLGTEVPDKKVTPTYKPGVEFCDLHEIFPEKISRTLEQAIPALGKKLKGFDDPNALMTAPETRSSSPVRILRGENYQSPAIKGLYPCGEGAGYAGGIVSAAVDGIKCAEQVIQSPTRTNLTIGRIGSLPQSALAGCQLPQRGRWHAKRDGGSAHVGIRTK